MNSFLRTISAAISFIGGERVTVFAILQCLLLFQSSPIVGQTTAKKKSSLNDPKELEEFLDERFPAAMKRLYAPGAVVAVVKDGKLFFAKGYGLADVEQKKPVSVDRTIFRIGSISKVFTAMAAVQLADRGKIRLTDDVNRHLKGLKLDDRYPEPVRVADLLSHTAGFDEIGPGRKAANAESVKPLKEFLQDRLIRRLPPRQIISYTTYGITLAGYLVENVSGTDLGQYFEQNIFQPLEMHRTNLGAIPADRLGDLAVGYTFNGQYNPQAFEYFHSYPASDINSTAIDMANFMIAHLQRGQFKDRTLLSSDAAREMHRRQFANHPALPGWALGFYETFDNNLRGLEHGGSMDGYIALIYLIPEMNIGLFAAANIEQGRLMGSLKKDFLDRYFPVEDKSANPELAKKVGRFGGKYRWDIYCHSCPPNARGFTPPAIDVTVNGDGTLFIFGKKWRQTAPLVFRLIEYLPEDRERYVVFRENDKGEITYLLDGTNAMERVIE